jgi:hypothetical protein
MRQVSRPARMSALKWSGDFWVVEQGAVHLWRDGVAGQEFGGEGWGEVRAGRIGLGPFFSRGPVAG